jgi:hypothetical protein
VPAIRSAEDYERCLIEILRAVGGRASRGHVLREFERRFRSSIPRDAEDVWPRRLDSAQRRLQSRGLVFAPDPDLWELA